MQTAKGLMQQFIREDELTGDTLPAANIDFTAF